MTIKSEERKEDEEAEIVVDATPVAPTPYVPTSETPAVAVATTKKSSNPPPRCAEGGIWGKVSYAGNTTTMIALIGCLCVGPFACLICCCPQDEMDAYAVNGRLYDAQGNLTEGGFVPERNRMNR
mmetsp:Transcript_42828/g.48668  ORF Transcript_42828/g.48668 Transcript_42828/m.48668 type:complete len:125 (-) Transcript_42828:163-537(-)|eukprot:CAMPEP_0194150288 /NCGR_PEP_ID=MMETSP0152-20130528/42525_1 /TAXON_ID=1049557 /ORGANISM="Thalassiothrix antarctica, Strain L6-D1" /LENGTH=124 /DNA_ID=CAMNT_0038853127 /DNA_START=12 /DNA_END=386 /DNA_ORIENTATION=+